MHSLLTTMKKSVCSVTVLSTHVIGFARNLAACSIGESIEITALQSQVSWSSLYNQSINVSTQEFMGA